MKRLLVLGAIALLGLMAVGAAQAAPTRWTPGATYYVSEDDATEWLESAFDYVYCRGIARYGKKGEFPYEEYTRFDCTIEMDDGDTCYDVRQLAVKGSRPGMYRMKLAKAQPKMWCG